MLPLNHINSALTKEERARLNANWDIIRDGINNLQGQLNRIVGGDVEAIIVKIEKALRDSDANSARLVDLLVEVNSKISQASTAITNANTATDSAIQATSNANIATSNANMATNQTIAARDSAINATNDAIQAKANIEDKLQEVSTALNNILSTLTESQNKLGMFETDSTKAIEDFSTKLSEFETDSDKALADVATAIQNADNATSDVIQVKADLEGYNETIKPFSLNTTFKKHQAARFNGSTYRAKQETTGNPLPVSPALENDWWALEAQRGVDGVGAVQSVNGIMPDTDGNIVLPDNEELTKLVSHQFTVKPTTNGQTTIEIPLGTFDKDNDTLLLFRNTTTQTPAMYSVNGKTITLVQPVADVDNTEFHILIMKNVLADNVAGVLGYTPADIEDLIEVNTRLTELVSHNTMNIDVVEKKLGSKNLSTGLPTRPANEGTHIRTNLWYLQTFEPKKTFVIDSVKVRIITAKEPLQIRLYELNDDYTIKGLVIEKFIPVINGLNTLALNFLVLKDKKYAIGQITGVSGDSTAVQRLNSVGSGIYEDDYMQSKGRVTPTSNELNPDYWMWFFNWNVNTTLQAQLDNLLNIGTTNLPTIIMSSVAPDNPSLGTIWIEV